MRAMKLVLRAFAFIHSIMALLFAAAALALVAVSARTGWLAIAEGGFTGEAAQQIIEAIGLLAAGVVALQISQTIAEEEVVREAHISAPTRVRRFLSRFFVVLIVALAIEALVATFKAIHEQPAQLVYAAAITIATGLLLAAWGFFIRQNTSAEVLEPEAMEEAKREDEKVG
jgi:hypothetical protein